MYHNVSRCCKCHFFRKKNGQTEGEAANDDKLLLDRRPALKAAEGAGLAILIAGGKQRFLILRNLFLESTRTALPLRQLLPDLPD
jgi:hypothetical protein